MRARPNWVSLASGSALNTATGSPSSPSGSPGVDSDSPVAHLHTLESADSDFTRVLAGKVVQSEAGPPSFVDEAWLRTPDLAWCQCYWEASRRAYDFTDPPPIDPAEWLAELASHKMRPERRAVARELATYADHGTGRNVRPSMTTLAARLGGSRARVNTHVRRLHTAGWLAVTAKAPRGVIIYALSLPESGTQPVKR